MTKWNKDPDDGVLCLVGTKRVLDRYGYCCDYNRCGHYRVDDQGGVIDRCIFDIGHTGSCHGEKVCHWRWNYDGEVALVPIELKVGVVHGYRKITKVKGSRPPV